MSYESNDFMVHYMVYNTITYLCVAGKKMHIENAFEFLKAIMAAFTERHGAYAQNLNAYEINDQFQSV